jgi:solute carrier family 25 iron transporter 28/37
MGEVMTDIVGTQGARGFMRGCTAIAAGTIPAHIALFSTFELAKSRLLIDGQEDPVAAFACGAASQFSHDLFLTPMDVIKQRMQLGCHSSISCCLSNIARREGFGALFRSMPTTLAMNLPFGGALVATNETIKTRMGLDDSAADDRSALPWYFVSGAISGAVASAFTQPLDVIKTRLQTQDCLSRAEVTAPAASSSQALRPTERFLPKYDGFMGALRTILREEGASAFFHGLAPRVLYTMPAAAICWGTYDTIKSMLTRWD